MFQGYDSDDAWDIACNKTCLSSDDEDHSDEELDDVDEMEREGVEDEYEVDMELDHYDGFGGHNQVGGVYRVAPVDVHLDQIIDLRRHWTEMSPRFGVNVVELRIHPARELEREASSSLGEVPPIHHIDTFLREVVTYLCENLPVDDHVQLELVSDNLPNGGVVNPLVPVGQIDEEAFLTSIENVIQSNNNVSVDDGSLTLNITHIVLPRGARYENQHHVLLKTFSDFNLETLKNRRCIHAIDRRYHPFCGVVSLMLAEELDGIEGLQRKRIFRKFKSRIKKISREARFICQRAGIPFANGVCIESFRKILELTPSCDHPLIIFSSKSFMTPILKCNLDAPGSEIYLLLDNNNHFGVISSINTFLGKPGVFCPKCEKFFTGNSTAHMCDRRLCKQCKSHCGNHNLSDSDKSVPNIVCDKCRRGFRGKKCFDAHLLRGGSPLLPGTHSVCSSFIACIKCHRDLQAKNGVPTGRNAYDTKTVHKCFHNKCRTCGEVVSGKHRCYIRALRPQYGKTKERYVDGRGEFYFFDMETCIVRKEDGDKVFEVNVVCVMDESGEKKWRFKGLKALDAFCTWIFLAEDSLLSLNHRVTFVSHNGSRFDMMFVLQWLCVKMTNSQPNIIFDNRSPMQIKMGKVYFIDSCLFIKAPLSSLPSQFGLEGVEKGDFPHEFNLKSNYNYVGQLPSPEFYGVRFMNKKKHKEFMKWWSEEDSAIRSGTKPLWNFKTEIVKYCMQDVDVLRRSWLAFEKSMFELTGLYPGILNMSAASFTNLVWKTTIESDREIGIVPRNNYFYQDRQSKVAYEWLSWLDAFYYGYELLFAGKCEEGEKRVLINRKYKVDGYHEATKTIFEFAGCAVHGCDKCTLPDKRSVFDNETNRDRKTQFDNRLARFAQCGYKVEVMWECEWKDLKERDESVRLQLEEIADETYESP